jgi:GrpB-like predicted nucleotidyltransferase (UPF0157 family)
VIFEGGEWRDRLIFRDTLRTKAGIRSRYEGLKLKLMRETGADREAYTAMKTDFVKETIQRAVSAKNATPPGLTERLRSSK